MLMAPEKYTFQFFVFIYLFFFLKKVFTGSNGLLTSELELGDMTKK